ncbi:hypothetical protein ACT7DB_34165 [Bacillus cereus]
MKSVTFITGAIGFLPTRAGFVTSTVMEDTIAFTAAFLDSLF